ncbi:MAG: ABC transporter permease, partial [Bryobacteraceae bacterium]
MRASIFKDMLFVALHAWRSWKSAKAVAALAVIALAVGIGSTTAIYTVINAVMLKPLPYPDGDRFVALFGAAFSDPGRRSSSTFPDLLEYQRRTRSFDVFGWFKMASFNLTAPGEPQHIRGAAVTPSLAHNLGVNPIVGQWFQDQTGAVISSALWNRLGADRDIVGKAITLNGRHYTVTGIMPPWFRLPVTGTDWEEVRNDVWIGLDPNGRGENPRE